MILKKKGHITIKNLTVFSKDTAMHGAIELYTKKYGFICLRFPRKGFPFYLYFSPNGTPWASTFMLGRKAHKDDWVKSRIRYSCFGHNFDVHGWNVEYQMENYHILMAINEMVDYSKWTYQDYAKQHGYLSKVN